MVQHTGGQRQGQDDLPLILTKVDSGSTYPSIPCIEEEEELHLHKLREKFWGTLLLCPSIGVGQERDWKLQIEEWDDVAAIVTDIAIATARAYCAY